MPDEVLALAAGEVEDEEFGGVGVGGGAGDAGDPVAERGALGGDGVAEGAGALGGAGFVVAAVDGEGLELAAEDAIGLAAAHEAAHLAGVLAPEVEPAVVAKIFGGGVDGAAHYVGGRRDFAFPLGLEEVFQAAGGTVGADELGVVGDAGHEGAPGDATAAVEDGVVGEVGGVLAPVDDGVGVGDVGIDGDGLDVGVAGLAGGDFLDDARADGGAGGAGREVEAQVQAVLLVDGVLQLAGAVAAVEGVLAPDEIKLAFLAGAVDEGLQRRGDRGGGRDGRGGRGGGRGRTGRDAAAGPGGRGRLRRGATGDQEQGEREGGGAPERAGLASGRGERAGPGEGAGAPGRGRRAGWLGGGWLHDGVSFGHGAA